MSRHGELCLKKIILSYDLTKKSVGVRHFLATQIDNFKQKYPTVEIDVRPRNTAAEYMTAVYRDGSERCYRTTNMSSMAIWNKCHRMVQDANDINEHFSATTMHFQRRSVQGVWNPWLWLGDRKVPKKEVPKWDRKLGDKEWKYYVTEYANAMRSEDALATEKVNAHTELPQQYTRKVQERWLEHVAPKLQTDFETNLAAMKANAIKGKLPIPVTLGEYRLFSMPDHRKLGDEAMRALRSKEVKHIHSWWAQRKAQLEPPQ